MLNDGEAKKVIDMTEKNYPEEDPSSSRSADKYLFINGEERLKILIKHAQSKTEDAINKLEDERADLKQKKINSGVYWYLWRDGKWSSKGRVEEYNDYMYKLEERINELETAKQSIREEMQSIVIGRVGHGHLIINSITPLGEFDEAMPLKDLYPWISLVPESAADKSYPHDQGDPPGTTDKTLFLTYCSAKKTDNAIGTPEEIYTGTRIKGFINKCKKENYLWGFLSAKYGIVLHDKIINNYDVSLKSLNTTEYTQFINQVTNQIRWIKDKYKISKIVFFQPTSIRGVAYRRLLTEATHSGAGNIEFVITQTIKNYPSPGPGPDQ